MLCDVITTINAIVQRIVSYETSGARTPWCCQFSDLTEILCHGLIVRTQTPCNFGMRGGVLLKVHCGS